MTRPWTVMCVTALGLAACGSASGSDAGHDAPACALGVELARAGASPFAALRDGDVATVVLGFQGFQMLGLDVRVTGAPTGAQLDFSAYLLVADTGVEASRAGRALDSVADGDARLVQGFLVFFNAAPLSQIQGHDADLELVVHAGACAGGARVRVHLSDAPPCIDPDASVPDAGVLDGAIPDGSLLCGAD